MLTASQKQSNGSNMEWLLASIKVLLKIQRIKLRTMECMFFDKQWAIKKNVMIIKYWRISTVLFYLKRKKNHSSILVVSDTLSIWFILFAIPFQFTIFSGNQLRTDSQNIGCHDA